MDRRILSISLISLLPLFAFQCHRWLRFADDFAIQVNPKSIVLTSDTLNFQIAIDATNYRPSKNNKLIFEIYASGSEDSELVSTVELEGTDLIDKEILQLVNLKSRLTALELVFHKYNGTRTDEVSPPLQIAKIEDHR